MSESLGKELLGAREVAQMLDLCERSIWRMADAGKLPRPLKVGSRTKWRRRDLIQWIDGGCKPVRKVAV